MRNFHSVIQKTLLGRLLLLGTTSDNTSAKATNRTLGMNRLYVVDSSYRALTLQPAAKSRVLQQQWASTQRRRKHVAKARGPATYGMLEGY
jgi:hypothetical protein